MKISDIKIEPSLGPLVRATAAQVEEFRLVPLGPVWGGFPWQPGGNRRH